MLDKFATLYKKRCNNQFVVAQRKPLGVFRQAVFLHVASLSLVFLLRQDTSWCTMLVVAGKSAGSSSHFGRWSICVQLVVFVLKLAALKSWIDLWLDFWFFFFSLLPLLFASVLKETAQSQRSLPDCGFLCDSHYTTHLLLSNCRTQNPFVFGLQSKPCYCR